MAKIKIWPSSANLASLQPASDYSLVLPDLPVSFVGPRPISVDRTLSGGAAVSAWAKSSEGMVIPINTVVDEPRYLIIRRMDASGKTDWAMSADSRMFLVVFDLASAVPQKRFGSWWYRVCVNLTIIQEMSQ